MLVIDIEVEVVGIVVLILLDGVLRVSDCSSTGDIDLRSMVLSSSAAAAQSVI